MTVSLSFAIAHLDSKDDRRSTVAEMVRKMGGPTGINAEVERWEITVDTGYGLWGTHRRAWAFGLSTKATHHLVMQNDLILCEDFLAGAKAALEAVPDKPVSLYANRGVMDTARVGEVSWTRIDDALGSFGQAIVLPIDMVADFLRFDRAYLRPESFAYDTRLDLWARHNHLPVYCTAPSLVQHALPANSSVAGYSNASRVARWFIGESVSALTVDWTQGVGDPPKGVVNQPLSRFDTLWRVRPQGL